MGHIRRMDLLLSPVSLMVVTMILAAAVRLYASRMERSQQERRGLGRLRQDRRRGP